MEQMGLHIWVSGKVQGVYFRETLRKVAEKLLVSGWVKNLTDGRVEIKAFGEKTRIDQLLEYCRQGPVLARVEKIEVEAISLEAADGFSVMREDL